MEISTKLEDYRLCCKLGEGTFSEVLKVKHRKTGKVTAMKRFRKHFNSISEVESLREIQALKRLNPHKHVVDLLLVLFDAKSGTLMLNFELMDCNLYELASKKHVVINEPTARNYMWQICSALEYMHSKGIFHRDIKPENILVKDNTIKLADFGSCRGIHSRPPFTEYIATRWYRSPECLLCDGMYSYKMDIWGAGCVLYEIYTKNPLFPGSNEVDQIHRIHAVLGTPSQKLLKQLLGSKANSMRYNFPFKEGSGLRSLLPKASPEFMSLLQAMLTYNPEERINSKDCLIHPFFKPIFQEKENNGAQASEGKNSKSNDESTTTTIVSRNNTKKELTLPAILPSQLKEEKVVHAKDSYDHKEPILPKADPDGIKEYKEKMRKESIKDYKESIIKKPDPNATLIYQKYKQQLEHRQQATLLLAKKGKQTKVGGFQDFGVVGQGSKPGIEKMMKKP